MSATTSKINVGADSGRRDFLRTAAASLASFALVGFPSASRSKSGAPSISHDAIIRMSLVDGVNALQSGKVSSLDYCMAALTQASRFERYNIFTQISRAYVQGAATSVDSRRNEGKAVGALQGVPYALKDSVDMVEYYTISTLSGKVSSLDYCRAALTQASQFEHYNIFTQISPVYVQGAATAVDSRRNEGMAVGALQGVPYALKDSVDMVEYYTISGHPSLKTFEPLVDADLVKIYKEADAICIGKTQLPALSLWWTTENPMTGVH